ncbi:MAG: hypothetical protein ABR581_02450 [Thermoleophilaceae bacterium]
MPTFARLPTFDRDWARLGPEERNRFRAAVERFVADLAAGRRPRNGLRVKPVAGAPGVFEMTWAPNGRATWQYGEEVRSGEVHVIWRRIGTHDVFDTP